MFSQVASQAGENDRLDSKVKYVNYAKRHDLADHLMPGTSQAQQAMAHYVNEQ
jgi:hypothetical protein